MQLQAKSLGWNVLRTTPLEIATFLYFVTLHADQLSVCVGSYTVRINNLLGLFFLGALALRFKEPFLRIEKKGAIALCALTFSMLLSLALSPYKVRCFFFLGMHGLTVLCYVVLPFILVELMAPKRLFSLYLFSFVVVGIYASLQLVASGFGIKDPFVGQKMWFMYRPNAFAYEPSFYALYMTPFVTWVNGHYILNRSAPLFLFKRLKWGHVIFVNTLFLASTTTTAFFTYLIFFALLAVVALVPSVAATFPSLRRSLALFALAFAGAMAALSLVAWDFARLYFLKFFTIGFMGHFSFFERWQAIVDVFTIFKRHPFFGVGLGGIPPYLLNAWISADKAFNYPRVFFIREMPSVIKCFEPSNVFTEILGSLGLVGLIAFAALLWVYGQKANQVYKMAAEKEKGLPFLLCLSSFTMLIVLQFNQGLFRPYVWVHLSLTYALFHRGVHVLEK